MIPLFKMLATLILLMGLAITCQIAYMNFHEKPTGILGILFTIVAILDYILIMIQKRD